MRLLLDIAARNERVDETQQTTVDGKSGDSSVSRSYTHFQGVNMHDTKTQQRLNEERERYLKRQKKPLRLVVGGEEFGFIRPSSTVPGKVEVVDSEGEVVGHQG